VNKDAPGLWLHDCIVEHSFRCLDADSIGTLRGAQRAGQVVESWKPVVVNAFSVAEFLAEKRRPWPPAPFFVEGGGVLCGKQLAPLGDVTLQRLECSVTHGICGQQNNGRIRLQLVAAKVVLVKDVVDDVARRQSVQHGDSSAAVV
jgi:hypothetical protein